MTELQLQDAILRNSLQILRLTAGEQGRVEAVLAELERELRDLLGTANLSASSRREIEALANRAREIIDLGYQRAGATVDTYSLAVVVAEKTQEIIEDVIPVATRIPSDAMLMQLGKDVLIDGAPSSAWWAKQSEELAFRFAAQVRQGIANGETQERIVARISGTRTEPGIMDVARRNARALVHSSVMTAANRARLETFRKNSRFIKGVRWLATLDGHTCKRCMAMDGQAWNLDGEKLKGTTVPFMAPPIHFGDRCVLSPIPKTFKEIGLDIPEPTDAGQRASSLGPVDGKTTFDEFLKRQSREFVERTLGKERADLFAAGRITVRDLVNGAGRELTLDELRAGAGTVDPSPRPAKPRAELTKAERLAAIKRLGDAEIAVEKKAAVQKRLNAETQEAAKDSRYYARPEFRGVTVNHFGKTALPPEMTDEAASSIAVIKGELDQMADIFGIPRIRGIRQTKSAHANMGDGILGVNPHQFNTYAARIGGKKDTDRVEELARRKDKARAELDSLRAEAAEVRKKRVEYSSADPEWIVLYEREREIFKQFNSQAKKFDKVAREHAAASRVTKSEASTWKVGDPVKDRPKLSTEYFEGVDKARNVLYHEFAHHLHQMLNKTERRPIRLPLEVEIKRLWDKLRQARLEKIQKDGTDDWFAIHPSEYAMADEQEWFAENFALYMMGRRDLVHPDLTVLIERIING